MFNRQEQLALLLLCGALIIGSLLTAIDYFRPAALSEFQVVPAAVSLPLATEPEPAEVPPAVRPPPSETRIALNAATALELQTLPGIGIKTAERILEYRRQHGPFNNLDELLRVPGVGPRTFEKIRSRLFLEDE